MNDLVKDSLGLLGVEPERSYSDNNSPESDLSITVSSWRDLESIKIWRNNSEHKVARAKGRSDWYSTLKVRIAKVEREY